VNERNDLPRRPARRSQGGEGGQLESARNYIERLRSEPSQEAVPKLIEVLGDESWYLRERAGEALAFFGEAAAPSVEGAARSGLWYTRAAALRVLGKIGAPSSLLLILDYARDRNQTIADAATDAMIGFCARGRALAVAKLLHARGTRLRGEVLDQLSRLQPDSASRLRRLIESGELMGPEGSLEEGEELRVAAELVDSEWGLAWEQLGAADTLPEPPRHILQFLRGETA